MATFFKNKVEKIVSHKQDGRERKRMEKQCVLAFGREDRQVTVTITPNDTIEDVAAKLHNAGLIRYPGLFKLYASFAVDEDEIKPGTEEVSFTPAPPVMALRDTGFKAVEGLHDKAE